jgi:hypothetical protein
VYKFSPFRGDISESGKHYFSLVKLNTTILPPSIKALRIPALALSLVVALMVSLAQWVSPGMTTEGYTFSTGFFGPLLHTAGAILAPLSEI